MALSGGKAAWDCLEPNERTDGDVAASVKVMAICLYTRHAAYPDSANLAYLYEIRG